MLRIEYNADGATGTAVPDARCAWYLRTLYERSKESEVTAYVSTENLIHELSLWIAEGKIPAENVEVAVGEKVYVYTDRALPRSFPSTLRKLQVATRAALIEEDRKAMQDTLNARRVTGHG
jgi:hypothetical protein